MKLSFAILFLSVWCGTLSAQLTSDAIYTEINGNQLTIHQIDAEHNCCFLPDLENIVLSENTISWYQTDSMGMVCGCECLFDYSVTIDSLNSGSYTAMVYSVYLSDTTFEGSVDFVITNQVQCDHNFLLSSIAGICHQSTSTEDILSDNFNVLINAGNILVSTLPSTKILEIALYNISGQIVRGIVSDSHTEAIIQIGNLHDGIYVISLITHNGQFTRKIAVLR